MQELFAHTQTSSILGNLYNTWNNLPASLAKNNHFSWSPTSFCTPIDETRRHLHEFHPLVPLPLLYQCSWIKPHQSFDNTILLPTTRTWLLGIWFFCLLSWRDLSNNQQFLSSSHRVSIPRPLPLALADTLKHAEPADLHHYYETLEHARWSLFKFFQQSETLFMI